MPRWSTGCRRDLHPACGIAPNLVVLPRFPQADRPAARRGAARGEAGPSVLAGAGSVEASDVGGVQPAFVGLRLWPALGGVLPRLLSAPGQQVDQREGVAKLLGATTTGVPGAVDVVA